MRHLAAIERLNVKLRDLYEDAAALLIRLEEAGTELQRIEKSMQTEELVEQALENDKPPPEEDEFELEYF